MNVKKCRLELYQEKYNSNSCPCILKDENGKVEIKDNVLLENVTKEFLIDFSQFVTSINGIDIEDLKLSLLIEKK